MEEALWLARLALVGIGSSLAARGYGDAAMWEAVIGAVLALIGAVWSYLARRGLKAKALSGEAMLGMAREMVGRQ